IDSGGNPNIPIIMNEDANQESSTNGFVNDTNRDNEVHALTDCMDADVSHGNMFNFVHQYYNSGLDTGWWHWDVGTAGVVQASRTESDYVADYLAAVTAALESDAIAASQPSYLRGEEPLSDAQANYLAAAEAFA